MTGLGAPSGPGVILAGFDYQYLFAWYQALALLREDDHVVRVSVEVREAGNVDDVVVERRSGPAVYHQVKYAVDNSTPLSHTWFTDIAKGSSRSVLKKFYDSYLALSDGGTPPEMVLQTNRMVDSTDHLLALLDGRDGKLMPRIKPHGPRSQVGRVRRAWAEHLGADERDLLDMLEHLAIHAGAGAQDQLRGVTGELMRAVGLRGGPEDVDAAVAKVKRRVVDGQHVLDADVVRSIIESEGLARSAPRSTLLIQAIDWRPWPEAATASVDWVDLFEGHEPRARRALRAQADWNGRLRPDLQDAVARLRAVGPRDVQVQGALRLSTWFLAGVELGGVAGFNPTMVDSFGAEWSAKQDVGDFALAASEHDLGAGDELAIGLSVTGTLVTDVKAYLATARLPVGALLDLQPATGVGRSALTSETAAHWAEAVLAAIRASSAGRKVHLFMFAPAGAALLLGHIWNRVPPTQLYDDLNRYPGYAATYLLPA